MDQLNSTSIDMPIERITQSSPVESPIQSLAASQQARLTGVRSHCVTNDFHRSTGEAGDHMRVPGYHDAWKGIDFDRGLASGGVGADAVRRRRLAWTQDVGLGSRRRMERSLPVVRQAVP
jgi:hypothetical protein